MENRLLIEMDRIKSMMSINENTELLNEGAIDVVLSKLITKSIATTEEKLILKFFEQDLSKQITSQADKVAFSKFIKSVEGQTFIKEVEAEIAKLTNPNAQRFAQRSLDRMENAATSWETLGVSSRPSSGGASTTAPAGGASTTAPAGGASTTVGNAIAKVDTKTVTDTLYSFEKLYPNLFSKKYWSYVNQSRIDGIKKEILRDFAGKDAKGIEKIIENKLSEAENVLKNLDMPPKQKTLVGEELSEFKGEFKRNYGKLALKGVGMAAVVYLFYHFIMEWYETGSPIAAATALPFRVWGDVKSGVMRNIPYDNTQDGFLKYVIKKYGDDDYKNKYTLTPPNSDGIIKLTKKNGGGTRAFKHNGYTFREIKP